MPNNDLAYLVRLRGLELTFIEALRDGLAPEADVFVSSLCLLRGDAIGARRTIVAELVYEVLVEVARAHARTRWLALPAAELNPMLWAIGHDLREALVYSFRDARADQRWLRSASATTYTERFASVIAAVRDAIECDWADYCLLGLGRIVHEADYRVAKSNFIRPDSRQAFWGSRREGLTAARPLSWRTWELGGKRGRMTALPIARDGIGVYHSTIRMAQRVDRWWQTEDEVLVEDVAVLQAAAAIIMHGRMGDLHPYRDLVAAGEYTAMDALRDVLTGEREPADAVTALAKAIDPDSKGMQEPRTEHSTLAEAYANAARKHTGRLTSSN